MKIKYLGTAAAEGAPALFCECKNCRRIRELKDVKNYRSRHQILINDDLLIDYPPDSFYHFTRFNIDFSKIHNILISHVHSDHFYPADFEYFLTGLSHPKKCLPFSINGSIDLYEPLKEYLLSKRNQGLHLNVMEPFQIYDVGNYKVIPLKASHGTNNPFLYVIKEKDKTMFYCHDTGPLKEETLSYLIKNNIHFDFISVDCTESAREIEYNNHMNLKRIRDLMKRFNEEEIIDKNTIIVLSHFSHNGKDMLYDDLSKLIKDDPFIISYDGLEIKL